MARSSITPENSVIPEKKAPVTNTVVKDPVKPKATPSPLDYPAWGVKPPVVKPPTPQVPNDPVKKTPTVIPWNTPQGTFSKEDLQAIKVQQEKFIAWGGTKEQFKEKLLWNEQIASMYNKTMQNQQQIKADEWKGAFQLTAEKNQENVTEDAVMQWLVWWVDPGLQTTQAQQARKRYTQLQSMAGMTTDQLVSAVSTNRIMPWSQTLMDMQKFYPEKYQEIMDWVMEAKKVDNINWFSNDLFNNLNKQNIRKWWDDNMYDDIYQQEDQTKDSYFDALTGTVFDKLEWQFWDDATEYISFVQDQLNTPEIKQQTEKVIEMQNKKDKLQLQINEIEKDIRGKAKSETPEVFLSAYISEMTEDLRDQMETLDLDLITEQTLLTSYTDTAMQNVWIYKDAKAIQQQEEMVQAQEQQALIAQQKAQFDQAMSLEKLAMDKETAEFEREKYYSTLWLNQLKYANELQSEDTDRLFDLMTKDSTSPQMQADLYDFLFNGIPMWEAPMIETGETRGGNYNIKPNTWDFTLNMDIPRTGTNVAIDTNNPWNITADGFQWQYKIDYGNKIGAVWTYTSPNGREYYVFPDTTSGTGALMLDVESKMTGNTRTNLWPNSSLKELVTVYTGEAQSYHNAVYWMLWASAWTQLKDLNAREVAKAIAEAEWFGDIQKWPSTMERLNAGEMVDAWESFWVWDNPTQQYQPNLPYNPYRAPKDEEWFGSFSSDAKLLTATLNRQYFWGNASEWDFERMTQIMRDFISDDWEINPTRVMKSFTMLYPSKESERDKYPNLKKNKSFMDSARDAIATNGLIDDFNFIWLREQIERGNLKWSIDLVENSIADKIRQKEWENYIPKSKVRNVVWQVEDLHTYVDNEWWVGWGTKFADKSMQRMLNRNKFNTDSRTVETKVTQMVAKMRNEMIGASATEQEIKMIEPLIPQIDDSMKVFKMKLDNLREEPLRQLNSIRQDYSLPILDYNSLMNDQYLVNQYQWNYTPEEVGYVADPLWLMSRGRSVQSSEDPLGLFQ